MTIAQIFDIVIAFLAVTFMVRGLLRGLSGEFFSLLGVVGGVFLAWKYSGVLAALIRSFWAAGNETLVVLLAMVLLYVAAVIMAAVICRMVKAFLKFTSLTLVDRMLGLAAGALKVIVLVLFVYGAVTTYSNVVPMEWMKQSIVMKYTETAWPTVQSFLERHDLFPKTGLMDILTPGDRPSATVDGL